ncbi:hypothetical protein GPOL_c19370 [Gordonia polyisoprenivorans VH2]|uniref:Uncharacterized protein n=2 Tax=Gordonia polyisoprenivorans TaxID=84595 RepID=H6MX56_GORPV|nr:MULTISPECIES: hypothetical protein [Gordonia]AFA72978.1 hypothetical protein GPOL_c19370 [Gordonia polyisoprenivorans VH2]MDF3282185.1 hypothetical protein [Gordonia sp. N1V]NKY02583.1 hypothetical protein [Gordonia polyisoprenivorans]QUD80894.1 hypothetical protein J8M97_13555 [Gordonia polyisoprenivorans]UZF58401.1 hypothetical protein LH935_10720 [Gordonia polyisoprenivorans]
MSFARLRERFLPSGHNHRRLYERIALMSSGAQRDELLVMAQRHESR